MKTLVIKIGRSLVLRYSSIYSGIQTRSVISVIQEESKDLKELKIREFEKWLKSNGAKFPKVEVKVALNLREFYLLLNIFLLEI